MISENKFFIDILYYVFPVLIGATLSLVGIQRKYFTTRKYIFFLWSVWAYILLSSVGSLLVTFVLRYIGTEIIGHRLVNCVLLSLLGAGLFLGIISKIPISGSYTNEASEELKTIRDFVYEFLDMSIEQKIRQLVQSQLKFFTSGRVYINGKYIPSEEDDRFLREVNRLIRGRRLSNDELKKYSVDFDEFVQNGDYASVVQVLVEYYDLDYVVKELSSFIKSIPQEKMEDKEQTKALNKCRKFSSLVLSYQWIISFIFWMGLGLTTAGIIHLISPNLINLITVNYLKPEWTIAIGSGLLFTGIVALLVYKENK